MEIDSVARLKDYSEVVITGGEPLLDVERTLEVINNIKAQNSNVKVYLHTAYYPGWQKLGQVLRVVDGLSYTLHEGASEEDIFNFTEVQDMILDYPMKSFRLMVFQNNFEVIPVIPVAWNRIKIENPMNNCPLPANEDLFICRTEG